LKKIAIGAFDMNLTGELTLVDIISDHPSSPALSGAWDVESTIINGVNYVFVSGSYDDAIQILTISPEGLLTPVGVFNDATGIGLNSPGDLEIQEIDGKKYLVVLSRYENAITSFRIDDDNSGTDGTLTHVQTIYHSVGGLNLDDPYDVEFINKGDSAFAVVSANDSHGLSVFKMDSNGGFTSVQIISDTENPEYFLYSPVEITSLKIGKTDYIFTGSDGDGGVNVFSMAANGTLKLVDSADFGSADIVSLKAVKIDGNPYLVGFDSYHDNLFVYEIANDGSVSPKSEFDLGGVSLNRASGLEALTIDGVQFFIATQDNYNGAHIGVFGVNADGEINLATLFTGGDKMDNSFKSKVIEIDGRTFAIVAAFDGAGVSVLEVGAQNDVLVGDVSDDNLVGMNGDDDLIGRGGNDTLFGGDGDDVLSGRIGNDVLVGGNGIDALVGGKGNDILDGGVSADFLSGGFGVDTASYAKSTAAVQVNIATGAASGGDAEGDLFTSIENLVGSRRGDSLTGNAQANRLDGKNGADMLDGQAGVDVLIGGGGNDTLLGGSENDKLVGGAGRDLLDGGADDDKLFGGASNDRLLGGQGNDVLDGAAGKDTLTGGDGDDILKGGAGADVFVFADDFGDDTVKDFTHGVDRIDLSSLTAINDFADVLSNSFGFSGQTAISDGVNSILLEGIIKADLTVDDFIF
jgi:Ca2+-binding RTX toxin-like protein